jgi:hypothetical protein
MRYRRYHAANAARSYRKPVQTGTLPGTLEALMRHRFTLMWALLVCMPATFVEAQSNPFAPVPRAVAVQFADSRKLFHVLKPTGSSSWTPVFPRIPGAATDRNGLPLSALDVAVAMDGQHASVSVTLIYGSPHQHRIPVATVHVTADATVRLEGLRDYGVWPITLSIVPAPATAADAPKVTSASASLDARVEPASDGQTFMVVLVNQSSRAVRGLQIVGERQGRRAISGYRKAPRHGMLIHPGDAFTFAVPASTVPGPGGTARVSPVDAVAITSVTWDDGTVVGDKEPATVEHGIAAGSALQLANVIAALREPGDVQSPLGLAALRERIAALSLEAPSAAAAEAHATLPAPRVVTVERMGSSLRLGMQQVRQLVLADLDAFLNQPMPSSAALWISRTMTGYEEWLARAQLSRLASR